MTLTTHIRIVEPTPVKPIFDECRRILSDQNVPYDHGVEIYSSLDPKNLSYRNHPGMGLHALLWVTYGADGPLTDYPPNDYEGHTPPPCSIEVGLNTAYAYRNAVNGSCGDLHAWLITQIGPWLDARNLTWFWELEDSGEWFSGYGQLPRLGDAQRGAIKESEDVRV